MPGQLIWRFVAATRSTYERFPRFLISAPVGVSRWLEIFPDFCPRGLTRFVVDRPIIGAILIFICIPPN